MPMLGTHKAYRKCGQMLYYLLSSSNKHSGKQTA